MEISGEVVAVVTGRPSITARQQRMRTHRPTPTSALVLFAAFDLLFLDDELLTRRPFRQRRRMLEDLELNGPGYQTVLSLPGEGDAMLATARDQGPEGVIAKWTDSPYRPGVRSQDWLKVRALRKLQVVVGGFIPAAAGVGGLLVGEPDTAGTGRLRFVGRVDHGFTARTRRALTDVPAGLETDRSPFSGPVGSGGGWNRAPGSPPRWVRPVVEVAVEHIGRPGHQATPPPDLRGHSQPAVTVASQVRSSQHRAGRPLQLALVLEHLRRVRRHPAGRKGGRAR